MDTSETEMTAAEWMNELSPDFQGAICLVAEDLSSRTFPVGNHWLNDTINDFAKVLEAATSGSARAQNGAISILAARLIAKLADQKTK